MSGISPPIREPRVKPLFCLDTSKIRLYAVGYMLNLKIITFFCRSNGNEMRHFHILTVKIGSSSSFFSKHLLKYSDPQQLFTYVEEPVQTIPNSPSIQFLH